jgi:hypothetical protein
MAISTYDELKAAIATWAHRTDLTAVIPDLITLAESRINRLAKIHNREQEADLTVVVGDRTIALPSGFIEPLGLWLTYYGDRQFVRYLTPEEMPVFDDSGQSDYWAIDAGNIAFERPADIAYTFVLRYTGLLTLSDANPTNWLLTNHPDLYLHAALMECAAYIRDLELLGVAKAAFDLALQEINDKEHRVDSLVTLSTEISSGPRRNILTDT